MGKTLRGTGHLEVVLGRKATLASAQLTSLAEGVTSHSLILTEKSVLKDLLRTKGVRSGQR